MIEILIVIGLMAALMSILVLALGNIMGTARETATKATLKKTSALLAQRIDAFERWTQRQDQKAGRGVSLNTIMAKKFQFRRRFPQQFSDDNEFTATATLRIWPQNDPNYNPLNHKLDSETKATESAECLYYFLTRGESFGAEPVGADAFSSSELADTDNDGLMEIVDAWGKPLRFYRWPTRLIRPGLPPNETKLDGSINSSPKLHIIQRKDPNPSITNQFYIAPHLITVLPNAPLDTTLDDPLVVDNDDPIGFTKLAPRNLFELTLHTRDTFHLPLLVSAGPDGEFGLHAPNSATFDPTQQVFFAPGFFIYGAYQQPENFGRLAQPDLNNLEALYDNLTNLNLQPGGG